jgi:hypothetical protein
VNSWTHALREKLAQLVEQGADKGLAARAFAQIRDGDLVEAEESLGHIELRLKAWMQPRS